MGVRPSCVSDRGVPAAQRGRMTPERTGGRTEAAKDPRQLQMGGEGAWPEP